jgi:hypothetical protein
MISFLLILAAAIAGVGVGLFAARAYKTVAPKVKNSTMFMIAKMKTIQYVDRVRSFFGRVFTSVNNGVETAKQKIVNVIPFRTKSTQTV